MSVFLNLGYLSSLVLGAAIMVDNANATTQLSETKKLKYAV